MCRHRLKLALIYLVHVSIAVKPPQHRPQSGLYKDPAYIITFFLHPEIHALVPSLLFIPILALI